MTSNRDRPGRGDGRQALMDALVRVFVRDGLDAVTFRSVAAEAGVTHGLASYHFSNRDVMISEALRAAVERGIHVSEIDESATTLDEFAARLPESVENDPNSHHLQQQLHYLASHRPELRADVEALREEYLAAVSSTLRRLEVSDDQPLARLVLAALDGIVFQQLFFHDMEASTSMLERLRDLLQLVQEHGLPRA